MDSDLPTLPEGRTSPLRRQGTARTVTSSSMVANPLNLQPLPRWIGTSTAPKAKAEQGAGTPDMQAAFEAGAASFALDQILRGDPPWRDIRMSA